MDKVKTLTKYWERKYRYALKKLASFKDEDLTGSIQVHKSNGCDQYYWYYRDPNTKKKKRVYLHKGELDVAKKIVKANYKNKAKRLLEKELKILHSFNNDFDVDKLDKLYTDLPEGKQKLFKPVVSTREHRTESWFKKPFKAKMNFSDQLKIETNKGELVRSKSEKILADLFSVKGLLYKYECPVKLTNGQIFYPDFTFYDSYRNLDIYWEHFGMMEDPKYSFSMMNKIITYETNGIFLGDRLIITMESSSQPLNIAWAEKLIERYLY